MQCHMFIMICIVIWCAAGRDLGFVSAIHCHHPRPSIPGRAVPPGDLFPGLTADKARYERLEAVLERVVAKDLMLVLHEPWLAKVVQLYETKLVRHGIMVARGQAPPCATHAGSPSRSRCGSVCLPLHWHPGSATVPAPPH